MDKNFQISAKLPVNRAKIGIFVKIIKKKLITKNSFAGIGCCKYHAAELDKTFCAIYNNIEGGVRLKCANC